MIVACQAMNFEAPPQYCFRMMNTKQCAYRLSRSLKVCERAPFLDELRRIMSKIWRLLRCTRAVRRMLRNITWCTLIDETCFIVKCTHFNFSFAILSFPHSLQCNCWRTTEKYSAETRLSRVVDCWLIHGVALAPFLPTTASHVPPFRRSGGASGRRAQDQRVASVTCSAQGRQSERGHTG